MLTAYACDLSFFWYLSVDLSLVEDAEREAIYLCGHSLGLCPKKTGEIVQEEIKKWQEM